MYMYIYIYIYNILGLGISCSRPSCSRTSIPPRWMPAASHAAPRGTNRIMFANACAKPFAKACAKPFAKPFAKPLIIPLYSEYRNKYVKSYAEYATLP